METIGAQKLWSFVEDLPATTVKCSAIRKGKGHRTGSFLELAKKIAELQFMNRDHVLLFRGQSGDYRNEKQNSTLKPTIFRPVDKNIPWSATLSERFRVLESAEKALVDEYRKAKLPGLQRMERQRIVRWSILQHYEVCPTPMLDVTHSLRIAASFASHEATAEAYIFVVGVPNLSGGITASAEAGLQTIRLSSVCPPSAVRPHIQEGYLLSEYPEMSGFSQKELYQNYEIDFGRRLVAKFRFDPNTFWKRDTFPLVSKRALYPTEKEDPLCELALTVKGSINEP
jgi:hypothetical protein